MSKLKASMMGITPLVGIMWLVCFIDWILPADLNQFGIVPRDFLGLLGVLLSPFLHASLGHLVSNSVGLLILPVFLSLSEGKRMMWKVVWLGIVISGLLTWLFGSSGTVIVGASGLVFVLIGYLLADCIFHPCARSLLAGLVTLLLFGGSVFSLYHFRVDVSLVAHAGGLITGIIMAKYLGGKQAQA